MKLKCLESKSSYVLLIDIINFKLRLINFVCFFLRHPVEKQNVLLLINAGKKLRSKSKESNCLSSNLHETGTNSQVCKYVVLKLALPGHASMVNQLVFPLKLTSFDTLVDLWDYKASQFFISHLKITVTVHYY